MFSSFLTPFLIWMDNFTQADPSFLFHIFINIFLLCIWWQAEISEGGTMMSYLRLSNSHAWSVTDFFSFNNSSRDLTQLTLFFPLGLVIIKPPLKLRCCISSRRSAWAQFWSSRSLTSFFCSANSSFWDDRLNTAFRIALRTALLSDKSSFD